jgi:hypothetical protein
MTETIKLTAEEKEFLGKHLGRIIDELIIPIQQYYPPKIKGDLSSEQVYILAKTAALVERHTSIRGRILSLVDFPIVKLKKLYLTVTGGEWEYGENKRNKDASLV